MYSSSNERRDPPEWDEFQPGNDRYINGRKLVIFNSTTTSAPRSASAKKAGSNSAWSPCSLLLIACGGVQTTKRTTQLQSTEYGYSVLRTENWIRAMEQCFVCAVFFFSFCSIPHGLSTTCTEDGISITGVTIPLCTTTHSTAE